tara:strand:- start:1741 stop:3132 length:1392 start_codon:yes stop_codon:yes gene_type:complete
MSLVTYTNYTSYKPVANLNAKVKRLVKKTKKVEEKPEFKFFPRNAHKRIKLPLPTFDLQKEADKIKPFMEKRTPEDEESIRNHDEHSFYAVEQYCRENNLEFDYDEHKALVDEATEIIGPFKRKFNVDRPYEVDNSIRPMDSTTNKTRSYPSGHACQAMLVALYTAQKHPTHKKQLIEKGKEGGLGRIKAGFHYIPDYIAGNLLAEKLMMIINREYVSEAPRIPRKKGQPAGSDKHSDLYTDENPKGTIHGLGFKDVETAKASVKKIESSGKSHAHKIQAAIAMEQRARVMGKTAEAAVYRKYIEKMKKITKQKNEDFTQKDVNDLEKFADRILAKYGIDVEFTRHFVDRLNDPRNSPAIKVSELQKFFKKIQRNKGRNIRNNPDVEAVLKDMSTNLNLPVVIKTKGDDSFEVTNKTIMRKKDFKTTSKVINYEKWSDKYKKSIDCDNPKGFSQRAHCQGRKK